ncbi:MAG: hypothetical protein Q7S92_02300 [Candidatus Diapherotrites archaeon]|nr:hypothetical protein [Candidatus Diapherotrites archaeon]
MYLNSNGLTSNQIFIIVIAVLMITSTVGFSLAFGNNSSTQPVDDPLLNQANTSTSIVLEAKEVEGIIDRFLPQVRIAGYTDNLNIDEIDAQILATDSVETVLSSEFSTQANSSQLVYVADVVLQQDITALDAANELTEKANFLSELQMISKALIKLPEKVTATNAELNISKEYSLPQPFVEALAQLTFNEGDIVFLDLRMNLVNNVIQITNAAITGNVSQTQFEFSTQAKVKVAELEPRLVFSGEFIYSGFDVNVIEQEIKEEVQDVNETKVRVYFGERNILVGLELIRNDLNIQDLQALAARASLNFLGSEILTDNNTTTLAIEYNGGQLDYFLIREDLLAALEEAGYQKDVDFTFLDTQATIQGEVVFSSLEEMTAKVIALRKILSEKYKITTTDVPVHQVAKLQALEPLVDSSRNQSFDYNTLFSGLVLVGNQVNDEITLPIAVQVQGRTITYAQGVQGTQQDIIVTHGPEEESE